MLRESGLGRSQLDRLFFQAFGISTRAYWNRRKLDSANALLATTANPIKEIAFRLGFRQASHFTRWYESLMGLTPNAYRNRERIQS
jgi:transcriptional regulator GlxA family with amidase domain